MKFISLLGIVALIGVAWLLSEHKRRFPFRAVLWGVTLQFFLGWFILKTGPGEALFNACQQLAESWCGFLCMRYQSRGAGEVASHAQERLA